MTELILLVLYQLRGDLPRSRIAHPGPPILDSGNKGGLPGDPGQLARRPRMLTVVLTGDKRRPSGQGPGARLTNGLASQRSSASRAARAYRRSPARPASASQPSRRAQQPVNQHPAGNRATERQRPTPDNHLQPRAKFSGQRDRHGDQAYKKHAPKLWVRYLHRCHTRVLPLHPNQGISRAHGVVEHETRYQPPGTGALALNGADPPLHAQKESRRTIQAGVMLGFIRNRFVGSYWAFSWRRRPWLAP